LIPEPATVGLLVFLVEGLAEELGPIHPYKNNHFIFFSFEKHVEEKRNQRIFFSHYPRGFFATGK
jgi:hypothetical protein